MVEILKKNWLILGVYCFIISGLLYGALHFNQNDQYQQKFLTLKKDSIKLDDKKMLDDLQIDFMTQNNELFKADTIKKIKNIVERNTTANIKKYNQMQENKNNLISKYMAKIPSERKNYFLILLIIFVCGAFGGLAGNFYRFLPDHTTKEIDNDAENVFLAYMLFGVIASVLSVLLLKAVDSSILEFKRTIDYYIFAAYCLLGSVFAKEFIRAIYDKTIKES